jgi:hypothetical protein
MFEVMNKKTRVSNILETKLLSKIGETGSLISRKRIKQPYPNANITETWSVPERITKVIWMSSVGVRSWVLEKELAENNTNNIDKMYATTTMYLKLLEDIKRNVIVDTSVNGCHITIHKQKRHKYVVTTIEQPNITVRFVDAVQSSSKFLEFMEATKEYVNRLLNDCYVINVDNTIFKDLPTPEMGSNTMKMVRRIIAADEALISAEAGSMSSALLTEDVRVQILKAIKENIPLNAVVSLAN